MLTKPATMALLVTSGIVVTGAIVGSIGQLAQAGSTSGTGTAASAAKATPPGQQNKTLSPSPAAEPPPKVLTIDPISVTGLAPGTSVAKSLLVDNPNNQDVVLQSVAVSVGAASPSPAPGFPCTSPADFEVVLTTVTPVDIKKNSSQAVPVTIRMNNSATRNQDGCKSKTFNFTFTATATSR